MLGCSNTAGLRHKIDVTATVYWRQARDEQTFERYTARRQNAQFSTVLNGAVSRDVMVRVGQRAPVNCCRWKFLR